MSNEARFLYREEEIPIDHIKETDVLKNWSIFPMILDSDVSN